MLKRFFTIHRNLKTQFTFSSSRCQSTYRQLREQTMAQQLAAQSVHNITERLANVDLTTTAVHDMSREALDQLLKRRFFFAAGFEVYGGVSGLYDYGVSLNIKKNIYIYIYINKKNKK